MLNKKSLINLHLDNFVDNLIYHHTKQQAMLLIGMDNPDHLMKMMGIH